MNTSTPSVMRPSHVHPDRIPQRRDRMIDGPAMQTIGTAAFVSLLLALVFFPPLGLLLGYIGLPIALFICMIPLYQGRRKVLARKRRWQALRGECPHCGYDLRQSTGQCPECGEMIASPGL